VLLGQQSTYRFEVGLYPGAFPRRGKVALTGRVEPHDR